MKMKYRPIKVDNTLRELTQHGTGDFPMSMDEQHVSDEGCCGIWHWHYEIQIGLVTQGPVLFETSAGKYLLQEGEGIFINSGVLHKATPTENPNSIYICVNFLPEMIYGSSTSSIYRDYVSPLLGNSELQSFALAQQPWHREICGLLKEMSRVNDAQEYGYELVMKMLVSRIWHIILIHNRDKAEKYASVSFSDKQRMKQLKTFIHQHYMESITLNDIAAAGHVSRGECCRVFRRAENTSPILYLKSYRIAQSQKMLANTDLSVSEIAYQTGFESSSYYAECFKGEVHCTPLEYRHLKTEKADAKAPPLQFDIPEMKEDVYGENQKSR